jgi:hypothetical protein
MKRNILLAVTIFTFSCSYLLAQKMNYNETKLTGNISFDSKLIVDNYFSVEPSFVLVDESDKKSPVLAGIMSAVIPGSGEFYVGDYIKAALFFAVDAALISTAIIYNNKGDTKEAEFKAFADEHWSVVKYADYLIEHKDAIDVPDDAEIPINRDSNLPPWEQIEDWSALNYAETPFSHHLPPHGDQQYYEEIGKYNQYSSGWDEFNPLVDDFRDVPQIMKDYAKMRGDANSAYNTASKLVIGVYINHLLSVIDAVWSAHRYNDNLAVNLRMKSIQFADRLELVPTVNFKYNF